MVTNLDRSPECEFEQKVLYRESVEVFAYPEPGNIAERHVDDALES